MAHQRLIGACLAALCVLGVGAAAAPAVSADPGSPGFTVQSHSRQVPRYQSFTYDTAAAIGVAEPAASKINDTVAASVDASVRRAVKAANFRCVGGGRCGAYEATLQPVPCVGGYLCIVNFVDGYAPGAATSYKEVDAFVFDPTSGSRVSITDEVTPAGMAAFVATVRRHVAAYQKRHHFYEKFLIDLIKAPEVAHWAPTARGIRLWFDKYVAAPGFVGVVSLLVPYPATAVIKP